MPTLDDIAPTTGDTGNSFEWLFDVNVGTPEAENWVNCPDITGLQPSPNPKFKDGTTYANKGQTSQSKTGEDFSLQVNIKGVRDNSGEFQPVLIKLIEAADAIGDQNIVQIRYYHATSATLAYKTSVAVNWTRANIGNDDIEFFSFTFTGQGDRVKIPNPAKADESS